MYANQYSGPGTATGGPSEGFAGNYHVRYFSDSGEFSDEYDLVIKRRVMPTRHRGLPTAS
jgi:hypothetical protein